MPSIRVNGVVYIWLALGFLILPFSWLIGAVIAAVFHEFCHYSMAKLLKVPISGISVGLGGMVMTLEPMGAGKEFAVAAAGPGGSLLLGALMRVYPELAICGLVQGIFNLLPVFPLDGGRLVHCVAGKWSSLMEICAITAILLVGFVCGLRYGIYPLLFAILVTAKAIKRKFPCKAVKLAVQ